MKKRTLVAMMAATMVMGMSFNAYAAGDADVQWIGQLSEYGSPMDWEKEAEDQARAWAKRHVGNIASIQDEKARYEACVNTVCDFLTYDATYTYPHIYYTIRDGKGVCSDYTALTAALCEEVGIQYQISGGVMQCADHSILKVTLNGVQYYSDPTNYDTGVVDMFTKTPGYDEHYVRDGLKAVVGYTGMAGDDVLVSKENHAKAEASGYYQVRTRSGRTVNVTVEDAHAVRDGLMSTSDYIAKYSLDK